MHQAVPVQLITTIRERCRVCYTCVRECPAKAISVSSGQAEVIPDRCIGCGNCVRVCSQHAKRVLRSDVEARMMIASGATVAAIIAPSFPAEFFDIEDHRRLVGMIRALGFAYVAEVAFGADLVADRYQKLLEEEEHHQYIATTCPAIVSFVERYYPGSTGSLAPIVSPMVAMARALRRIHGSHLKVAFVGPCIAKKTEAVGASSPGEVDAALTFGELRDMFARAGITPDAVQPSDFDPPEGGYGMLFPLSRGILQAANIPEDLLEGDVVAADGRAFTEAIREFDSGDLNARLLEVLACNGCVMGPGMTCNLPLFRRRARVSQYAREKLKRKDLEQWRARLTELDDRDLRRKHVHPQRNQHLYSWIYSPMFADSDLRRQFSPDDMEHVLPSHDELEQILRRMGKERPEDELNCGACGYDTCREHAVAVYKGLAESEMCLPHTIEQLRKTVRDLDLSHKQLASTQAQLMQSEKLASMGQLAAGIAHEVNNPLGVVLMYAHLLLDEEAVDPKLHDDLQMIVSQADRCKKIVAGLLNFARQNRVALLPTDLRGLAEGAVAAVQPPPGVEAETVFNLSDPVAELDKDQITQVLTNLIANAYAAMEARGGKLTLRVSDHNGQVRFQVSDTGTGIPKAIIGKIFEPFFTTKKMGKGTGLGLAVSYGIVKMHRGDIHVDSNADPAAGPTGTTVTVTLPRAAQSE
jgi:signal transduction histidine kinase/iron only hydrogenase large subunit-like protein